MSAEFAGDVDTFKITVTVALTKSQQSGLAELARHLPQPSEKAAAEVDEAKAVKRMLTGIAHAGIDEYVKQSTGTASLGSLSQLREERLTHLVDRLFEGTWPSEHVVANLLGLTVSETRALLARSLAHHRDPLSTAMLAKAREALEQAKPYDDGKRLLTCDLTTYHFLVETLSTIKDRTNASLEPLSRRTDAVGKYLIPEETRQVLCDEIGADGKR